MFILTMMFALCWTAAIQSMSIDIVVAKDGSGDFMRIIDAIQAAPSYGSRRFYIKIKRGIYNENVIIAKDKTPLTLLGDGIDKTIISGSRSASSGLPTFQTSTVGVEARGFIAQDITFENVAGPYHNQAVALRSGEDYLAFYRCRFRGFQDTLYAKSGIQFFRECEIYGTIDFIFGNAQVVFQNCLIYARTPPPGRSNTITAQGRDSNDQSSGTVFHNCTITATQGLRQQGPKVKTYLGRPWRIFSRTVVMQSVLDDLINPRGWLEWNGDRPDRVYYAEYKNRGPGAITTDRVQWENLINSSAEAAKYTVRNFIHGLTWIPATGIPFFLDLL